MRLLSCCILVFIVGQSSAQNIKSEQLLGCWTHSREESGAEFSMYRPCDYMSFPPSRFRYRMILKEDQKCEWLYLAPNDAHRMIEGSWMFESESSEVTIYEENGEVKSQFKVSMIAQDELRITQIE